MSLNIQNHMYPSIQSDKQRLRAENFVNKTDKEITHMAARSYHISHYDSDRKFNSRINKSILSLPAVALASSLIMKDGIKSAAKNSAGWGLVLAVPAIVNGFGKAVSKPDLNGKKHNNMPFGLAFGASIAGIIAGQAGLNKIAENETVNKVADTIINGAKNTYKKVKKEINISDGIKNKFSELKESVKKSDFFKPVLNFAENNAMLKTAKDGFLSIAGKVVRHAPVILTLGVFASVVTHALKEGNEIASNRRHLKDAQLNTARAVIDSYKQENEALKA